MRNGQLFGDNVGLFKLDDAIPMIEVRTESDVLLAETILSSALYAASVK